MKLPAVLAPRIYTRRSTCTGCNPPALDYIVWHWDAEKRAAKGQRQVKCPVCKLWTWPVHLRKRKKEPRDGR